jgi:hypothetical protein
MNNELEQCQVGEFGHCLPGRAGSEVGVTGGQGAQVWQVAAGRQTARNAVRGPPGGELVPVW